MRSVISLAPDPAPSQQAAPTPAVLGEDNAVQTLVPVPPVRTETRRSTRLGLGLLLVAACAALPWAVPQVPDLFAGTLPDQSTTTVRADLPIDPPILGPPAPVKRTSSLVGERLTSAGTPLEIVVPRLRVSSPVVPISGQSGELFPPDDPQILGWWQEGAGVGLARGSAVVTGHTVNAGGGAFDHLGELVPGDKIKVRTAAGTIDYLVREARDVPVEELARTAESIFGQSVAGRLVLITCSDFDGSVYRSNAVVYAVPVKDAPRV